MAKDATDRGDTANSEGEASSVQKQAGGAANGVSHEAIEQPPTATSGIEFGGVAILKGKNGRRNGGRKAVKAEEPSPEANVGDQGGDDKLQGDGVADHTVSDSGQHAPM